MAILSEQLKERNDRRKKEYEHLTQLVAQCTACLPEGRDFPPDVAKELEEIAPGRYSGLIELLERRRKAIALHSLIAECTGEVPPEKNAGFEYQRRANMLLLAILLKLHDGDGP